jgi:hypothetical protein
MLYLKTSTREIFFERFNALTPQSPRQWGKLDAGGMMVHLRIVVELSLGAGNPVDYSNFFSRTVYRWFAFNVMPWPKGKIVVPDEYTPPMSESFDAERTKFLATVDRFLAAADREPTRATLHPMFGPMTLRYWQKAHGKHFNHHLTQFGV